MHFIEINQQSVDPHLFVEYVKQITFCVVNDYMTDEHIIYLIWVINPLLDRFETDPYRMSLDELATLKNYDTTLNPVMMEAIDL